MTSEIAITLLLFFLLLLLLLRMPIAIVAAMDYHLFLEEKLIFCCYTLFPCSALLSNIGKDSVSALTNVAALTNVLLWVQFFYFLLGFEVIPAETLLLASAILCCI